MARLRKQLPKVAAKRLPPKKPRLRIVQASPQAPKLVSLVIHCGACGHWNPIAMNAPHGYCMVSKGNLPTPPVTQDLSTCTKAVRLS